MIVYTPHITERLKYIAAFISGHVSEHPLLVTDNKNEFLHSSGIKINYSAEKICEDELQVIPAGLLSQHTLVSQSIECFDWNGHKAFFRSATGYPFDIFSASFYLLTRYEEYLPHEKDLYGRYAHENSLAYRENLLHLPLINIWLGDFSKELLNKFPNSQIQFPKSNFIPTYDIDEAFAYRHKSLFRLVGAKLKNLVRGEFRSIIERMQVILRMKKDPYDSFAEMDAINKEYKLSPLYFFLVADKNKGYDRNIPPANKFMRQLIRSHAEKYKVGIHPSWQSGDNKALLKSEIGTIQKITGKKITVSRQHFIRFNLPETYRELIANGITEDHSMGYGSINGFRASTASSFYWYDLEKEEATSLKLFPFCYMEANSFYEQKNSPQQALDELKGFYAVLKNYGGNMITIWHNSFLGTARKYRGWKEVYLEFLKYISG